MGIANRHVSFLHALILLSIKVNEISMYLVVIKIRKFNFDFALFMDVVGLFSNIIVTNPL